MAMKKCPFCAEEIQEAAIKCKHCGEMLAQNVLGRGIGSANGAEADKRDPSERPARMPPVVAFVLGAIALLLFGVVCSRRDGCATQHRPRARSGPPAAQIEFERPLRRLHDEYVEAERSKNQLNQRGLEGQVKAWGEGLKASPVSIDRWQCNVVKVYGDRSLVCALGIVEYHIELATSEAASLSQVGAGTTMHFSGRAVREKSFSWSGALEKPEIEVEGTSIGR